MWLPLSSVSDVVLFVVRVVLGVTMVYYGSFKIRDVHATFADFAAMGFTPGWLFGSIGVTVEFVGGVLVTVGVFPGVVAALFAVQMITGTVWKVVATEKDFTDWSYDVLLLALCLVIIAFGPGVATLPGIL